MPTQFNHRSLLPVILLICLVAACAAPPTSTPSTAATAAPASSTPNLPSPSPTMASSPAPATRTPRATAFVELEPTEPPGGGPATPTAVVPTATPFSTRLPPPTVVPHPLALSPANVGQIVELARLGKGFAYDVAWSPDGRVLAVAGSLGVDLYNTQTFQLGSRLAVVGQHVAFGPAGGILVVASNSRVWWVELSTGQVLREISTGMERVSDIQFSPHGTYLALLGYDCAACGDHPFVLHVLNAATGETQFYKAPFEPVGMSFSHDGREVALGNAYYTRLFDAATGEIVADLPVHTYSPILTPEGALLIIHSAGARLALADPTTGEVLRQLAAPATERYLLSPDGQTLALLQEKVNISGGRYLEFWDLAADQSRGVIEISADLERFAFSPTGEQMAVATYAQAVQIVSVPEASVAASIEYDQGIVGLGFAAAEGELASAVSLLAADEAGQVRRRDPLALNVIGADWLAGRPPQQAAFSPDGELLALEDGSDVIDVYSATAGLALAQPVCVGAWWLQQLAFSADGRYLAADCGDVNVWEVATWDPVVRRPGYAGLIPLSDGRLLSLDQDGGAFQLVDVISGAVFHVPVFPDFGYTVQEYYLMDWAVSRDLALIALASASGDVVVWKTGEPEPLYVLTGHQTITGEAYIGGVEEVEFSPASSLLASAGVDGTVRLWNAATGAPLGTLYDGVSSAANLTFSPDGRYLAGSTGGTLRVWGLPAP